MKVKYLLVVLLLLLVALPNVCADNIVIDPPKDNSLVARVSYQGTLVDIRLIGPGLPPETWVTGVDGIDVRSQAAAATITDVPILNWSYGCSATSAAMLFGFRDRHGYPNMYAGPANGGVFPLNNDPWGESLLFPGHGECPLSATHNGYDGRATRAHVDDYWSAYDSMVDPYFGAWAEHADFPADCTGDFMGTNQYQRWHSTDGSTWFVWHGDNSPCYDFTAWEAVPAPAPVNHVIRDGAHGMKLFIESRGYTTVANGVYNQYIAGFGGLPAGFTYAQYKAEIDAGNPVLIQLDGHTMLGVGYNDDTPGVNQVIIHDTWDHSTHTMIWGSSYGGMAHQGVTVFHLTAAAPVNNPPVAGFSGAPYCGRTGTAITTFSGAGSSDPDPGDSIAAYEWDWGDGTAHGSGVTPSHTYSAANYGLRTVQLRVQDTHGAWSGWVSTAVPVNARPVAGFTGAPYSGRVNVPIQVDVSGSTDAYGGLPLEYRYDWENDGTYDTIWTTITTPTHTWTTPGTKTIALLARDQFQCPAGTWARWQSAKVTTTVNVINYPPVAEANGPYTVNDGQAVAFSSAGSYDPDPGDSITYAWDFRNDGGAPDSTAPNPSYTYPTWGAYTARLTVTDSFGLTATDTASVTVRAYPIANAGPDQFMLLGETVSFNGGASTDPDGTIVAYDWNFGDGSAHGTGVTTTHLYAAAGTYNVVLTVTDNDGLTDTDTAVVNYMTSCDGINYLKTVVNGMTIKASVKTGLNSKLTNANTLCVNGQKASAIKTMNNFITQCNTQRGLALTNAQADTLVNWANRIIAALRRM